MSFLKPAVTAAYDAYTTCVVYSCDSPPALAVSEASDVRYTRCSTLPEPSATVASQVRSVLTVMDVLDETDCFSSAPYPPLPHVLMRQQHLREHLGVHVMLLPARTWALLPGAKDRRQYLAAKLGLSTGL